MKYDFLIVGSGLTGSVIARLLADAGKSVLMVERRNHHGGNVHDQVHPNGIRFHTYGPHYFRTNSEKIWKFARRFGEFYKFEARVMSLVDGRLEHWPVQQECVERLAGKDWKRQLSARHPRECRNFEEACLAMMPWVIYEKFVKGYTEKQWGVPASSLAAGLAKRFDMRTDGDTRLSRHKWQGLPTAGYTDWMSRMTRGIPMVLNQGWWGECREFKAKHTVFTGRIDMLFQTDEGVLKYRGQERITKDSSVITSSDRLLQVNYPAGNEPCVRRISWRPMMCDYDPALECRELVTWETPRTSGEPGKEIEEEYPFPDAANARLYASYRKRANQLKNFTVCGRLGECRYLDMDMAIGRAMVIAERLLKK